jgi:beta-glucanase (GH16 family)
MTARRRPLLLVLAAAGLLLVVGVAAERALDPQPGSSVAAPPAQRAVRADEARLDVSRPTPIVGEHITFTGRLYTEVARPVFLESGGPDWTVVATGDTDHAGRFSLTTTAPASSERYRVRAPSGAQEQGRSDVSLRRQVTTKAQVTPVAQTAELDVAPAPIGQSMEGIGDLTPASARFHPPRPGRTATLERRSRASWKPVATSAQDPRGRAHFDVEADDTGAEQYRVVAAAHDGAPAVASASTAVVAAPPVWRDEFDGTGLDTSVWSYRHLGVRSEASQRRCAESSTDTVSVSDGRARLLVRDIQPPRDPAGCPHGEYLNAHIGTQETFSFTYGVLAARIKFPRQRGQHGALWSQPTEPLDVPGDPGVSGAEIDVVEYFGDSFRNGALQHSVYWKGRSGQSRKVGGAKDRAHLLDAGKTWSNSFHVYSVEWTPTEYIFRVDGHQTFRTTRGVSHTPQYVILSLLTSDWELEHLDARKLNPMQADWVRVWQPARP